MLGHRKYPFDDLNIGNLRTCVKGIIPKEVHDITGIRVVCITKRQAEDVVEILKTKFSVIEHEVASADPYTMGYKDEKLILTLGPIYSTPEYASIRDIPFEVQVRFIFVDAWAKFSHAFAYKDEASIPPELLRKVQVLGAACEMLDDLADTYASSIERFRTGLIEEFKAGTETDLEKTPINIETLQAYLEFKYPARPIDRNIQSLIVRDINKERYKNIADIDHAVTFFVDVPDYQ